MSLKQFLLNALATGEHAVQVVGVGGITTIVLNHDSFLQKLIEAIEAYETGELSSEHQTALANTPAVGVNLTPHLTDTLLQNAPAMAPVPTPEQIAEYLKANPLAGMTLQEGVSPGDPQPKQDGVQS